MGDERIRLDVLLTERGLTQSRSRARDAIIRGQVHVDGAVLSKPGTLIAPGSSIKLTDPADGYVSRSALKLVAGLKAFQINLAGRRVLDVGASTGGFTQVALDQGATHVTAMDVGHSQLHPKIASDPRVLNLESFNARHLAASHLPGPIDAIVCDVSFISLKLAISPALHLAEPGAVGVLLIKPQFEVGRADIGKGGVVKDAKRAEAVTNELADWFASQAGWTVIGLVPSPIAGSDGNQETLIGLRKSAI